jgi:hypothetical protein
MTARHADELEVDEALVRRLLAEQFREWAERPVTPVAAIDAIQAARSIVPNHHLPPRARTRTRARGYIHPVVVPIGMGPGAGVATARLHQRSTPDRPNPPPFGAPFVWRDEAEWGNAEVADVIGRLHNPCASKRRGMYWS